jgi:hypothetical protein
MGVFAGPEIVESGLVLVIKVRGTDGLLRSANITLA